MWWLCISGVMSGLSRSQQCLGKPGAIWAVTMGLFVICWKGKGFEDAAAGGDYFAAETVAGDEA